MFAYWLYAAEVAIASSTHDAEDHNTYDDKNDGYNWERKSIGKVLWERGERETGRGRERERKREREREREKVGVGREGGKEL